MSGVGLRRRLLVVVSGLCLALSVAFWVLGERAGVTAAEPTGLAKVPTGAAVLPTSAPVEVSPAAAQPAPPIAACAGRTGVPRRVAIGGLGVDTVLEQLRAEGGSIGDPVDKDNLGWFPSWPSVQPGAGQGAVLLTGHTYHDDSAVFKESFASTDKLGMLITLTLDDGTLCHYKVVEQLTVAAGDYQQTVESKDLYDLQQARPERLLIATCSGWNGSRHTTESLVLAEPVAPPGA